MIWTSDLVKQQVGERLVNHSNQAVIILSVSNCWVIKHWNKNPSKVAKDKPLVNCSQPELLCNWLTRNGYEPA